LPGIDEASAAYRQLSDVVLEEPNEPISHAAAVAMLSTLFGALSRRKADDENSATLLAATADLFNPLNDAIGRSTGLWKPVSKHPIVLALAVKHLIATSVFSPSPSELRAAMRLVVDKLSTLAGSAQQFVELVEHADAIAFEFDRGSWDAMHLCAAVSSDDVAAVEEASDERPGSPRRDALGMHANKKFDAEQAQFPAPEEPAREAACAVAPAKRTRKLKRGKHE
jgi:hypothetical protein